jgi:hypothetical protein
MVDEEALTDLGTRVDLDAGNGAPEMRDYPSRWTWRA